MNGSITERHKPLILVADDDEFMLELFVTALEGAEFEVETVSDGRAAITRFFEISPDLAILDILMPGVDGYAACAAIRRSVKGRSTPIMMVTGLDDSESITKAFKVGATHFVTKPINWELFEHQVWYLWRANRALRDLENYSRRIKELELSLQEAQGSCVADNHSNSATSDNILNKLKSIKFLGETLIKNIHEQDKSQIMEQINTMLKISNNISHIIKE